MTALYDSETGKRTPCTVLQMERVQVVGHKTRERHGYFAVCVASGWKHPRNVGSAMLGVFSKTMYTDAQGGEVGLPPKRDVSEFRVRDASALVPVGRTIEADWFKVGQFVDAKSENKGKGFAGGMKRWGFGGQPASHGVSLTHRSMGSAGGSQGSGSRVHPGKKMAGNMGGYNHTVQNLKVMLVDETNGLVVVSGMLRQCPGCVGSVQAVLTLKQVQYQDRTDALSSCRTPSRSHGLTWTPFQRHDRLHLLRPTPLAIQRQQQHQHRLYKLANSRKLDLYRHHTRIQASRWTSNTHLALAYLSRTSITP